MVALVRLCASLQAPDVGGDIHAHTSVAALAVQLWLRSPCMLIHPTVTWKFVQYLHILVSSGYAEELDVFEL